MFGDTIGAMTRRTASLAICGVALVTLLCVAFLVPMPYVVLSPGVTENTLGTFDGTKVIKIRGHKTYPTKGHLNLTTVSVTSADYQPRLSEILSAWWSPRDIVVPRDVVYAPRKSVQQVEKENRQAMLDSQSSAVAAGLGQAGISAVKVAVRSVVEGAPAEGKLRSGDVIAAVDGEPVRSRAEVIEAVSTREPGSPVVLTVRRHGERRTVRIRTEPSPDDPDKARVGVELAERFDPPFAVDIELGQEIGGPSAGLMFSLAIYDLITPGALTGGAFVAGTGTITADGTVGVIGGVQQKIAGAYRDGATVFLVPAGDCPQAARSDLADDVRLVKVTTLDQAVRALRNLRTGNTAAVPSCGTS